MGREGITQQFRELQFKSSTMLVFFFIRDLIESNEDGRTACSPRYAAEELDLTEKVVRNAMKELRATDFIKTETRSRLYTMVSLSHRGKGAEKGAEKGAGKLRQNQYDLIEVGAEKGAEKGHTGVTAVRRSSVGVDVVDVGLTEELGKPRATPSFVHKSKPPATTRYETAIAKAPALPDVTMHIDRIYADLSGGHKYPWSGNQAAATLLADLIFSHGAPLVIAAAERYFVRGHAWTEERAWAIDEFSRQFAKLITLEGVTKRAAQAAGELKDQARPSTPKELRAQLAEMRRRQYEQPIVDYKPEDVHLVDDLRRLRAKTPAAV